MRLISIAGAASPKLDADAVAVLVATAESMLRGGVTISPEFWADLSDEERSAFVVANSKIQAERAAMIGIATMGPSRAADILAISDGGAFREALNQALDRELLKHAAESAPPLEGIPG